MIYLIEHKKEFLDEYNHDLFYIYVVDQGLSTLQKLQIQ